MWPMIVWLRLWIQFPPLEQNGLPMGLLLSLSLTIVSCPVSPTLPEWSGYGTVGRSVASYIRGLQFESRHRALVHCQLFEKTKIQEKRPEGAISKNFTALSLIYTQTRQPSYFMCLNFRSTTLLLPRDRIKTKKYERLIFRFLTSFFFFHFKRLTRGNWAKTSKECSTKCRTKNKNIVVSRLIRYLYFAENVFSSWTNWMYYSNKLKCTLSMYDSSDVTKY